MRTHCGVRRLGFPYEEAWRSAAKGLEGWTKLCMETTPFLVTLMILGLSLGLLRHHLQG